MGTERELKYDLEADRDIDLTGLPGRAGPEHRVTLVADYWDTPSGRLRAWGVTLRHRRASDDSELGWTVKIPIPVGTSELSAGAARTRRELDIEGHPSTPPARVLAVVSGLAGGEPLGRVARLTTVRTSTHRTASGARPGIDPGVRVDCDRVAVEVGDDVHRFHQLEVESTGDEDLLGEVETWASRAGLTVSAAANKLEQALGPGAAAAPQVPLLDRRSRLEEVVRVSIAGPVRTMVAHDPLLRDELAHLPTIGSTGADGEGVPSWEPDPAVLRAATAAARRLRDDLTAMEPFLDPHAVSHLRIELDWWTGLLGDLEDALALRSRLRPFGRADTFVSLVEDRAEVAGRRISAAIYHERFHALLADLLHVADDAPLRDGIDGRARAARPLMRRNRRAWKLLRETVERAGLVAPGSQAAEDAATEVSAAAACAGSLADLSAPVLGAAAADAADRLERLRAHLAARRDAVQLQRWIEHFVATEGRDLDPATAFRAGELHMAARLDPMRTTDWHPLWDRARKRRPSRW